MIPRQHSIAITTLVEFGAIGVHAFRQLADAADDWAQQEYVELRHGQSGLAEWMPRAMCGLE